MIRFAPLGLMSLVVFAGCVFGPSPDAGPSDAGAWPGDAGVSSVDAGGPDAAEPEPDPYDYPADYEAPVRTLPLPAPASEAGFEYSGLAWYGDVLILLPQFADGVWAIDKDAIDAHLSGESPGALPTTAVLMNPPLSPDNVPHFDGLEAIAFAGDTVIVSIETSGPQGGGGYLVRGTIAPDLSGIDIDIGSLTINPSPLPQETNSAFEAMVIDDNVVLTMFELNGVFALSNPTAPSFSLDLAPADSWSFPALEYRVTDATDVDDKRRFWVINYRFPGDGRPVQNPEPLAAEYGQGATHAAYAQVERLVEMELTDDGIVRVDRPPLQLQLLANWTVDGARNWEGVVRYEDRGFLVITDLFPDTILGFVPLP